ncbi:hypothetical protein protein [Bacillus cereus G9241]|nr:hypothetical protein protein [Bacillus cereus G9241]
MRYFIQLSQKETTTIRKGADQYDEQNEIEQFLQYTGHDIFHSYRCKSCCFYFKQVRRIHHE